MRTKLNALCAAATAVALAGCGSSSNAPQSSAPIGIPDVIVTLDGKQHTCVVALSSEATGNVVSCDDVASFIRDELRVRKGSLYDLRTTPDVDRAEVARIGARLQTAGYLFVGGHEE